MCMQDLFIARHTSCSLIGSGNTIAIPPNVNRIGLILSQVGGWTLLASNNRYISIGQAVRTLNSWNTTDTNEVPPTDNTGTGSATSFVTESLTVVLRIEEYGSVIQEPMTFSNPATTAFVMELVADAVLQERLNHLEHMEGWPMYGLPAKLKVPNA